MKTPTFTGPNYVLNYNAIQLTLPLDLSFSIDNSDLEEELNYKSNKYIANQINVQDVLI